MDKKDTLLKRVKPLFLSLIIVILDQISKIWVIKNIPLNSLYKSFFNDFLWIIHVRNTGVGFSLGAGFSDFLRIVLFIIFPLVIMGLISYIIVSKKNYLIGAQRYFAAGILGGGLGTLVDRVFRFQDGVVDFISVKFYGIFGMDRWPTFNVSDSCVVVFTILFAISILFAKGDNK